MSDTDIKIENLSKQYQLGLVGTNTLKGDLQCPGLSLVEDWWYRMRNQKDKIYNINQKTWPLIRRFAI